MEDNFYENETRDLGDPGVFLNGTDFPREKLLTKGPASLSDRELMTILINTGVKGKNAKRLATEVLEYLDGENELPTIDELTYINGLGETKACTILAMLEFGRRRWGALQTVIKDPKDAFALIKHYGDRKQECFICISLNGAHEVLALRVVSVGLVNKTMVHPREVFADPIVDRATAVIVAHNHPSGQLHPSPEDDDITRRLLAASEILGINFLDHLIFTKADFFSYKKNREFFFES